MISNVNVWLKKNLRLEWGLKLKNVSITDPRYFKTCSRILSFINFYTDSTELLNGQWQNASYSTHWAYLFLAWIVMWYLSIKWFNKYVILLNDQIQPILWLDSSLPIFSLKQKLYDESHKM